LKNRVSLGSGLLFPISNVFSLASTIGMLLFSQETRASSGHLKFGCAAKDKFQVEKRIQKLIKIGKMG
jgi:hypothetical protein